MASRPTIEKYEGSSITDVMIRDAASLFSNNYGIWGPSAGAKIGKQIRMSPQMLKLQCLAPDSSQNVNVRATYESELVGNVFATRWTHEDKDVCWIAQLCVKKDFRHKVLATRLLSHLRDEENDGEFVYGIFSSHPFAIAAALRAFGGGIERFDFEMTKIHAKRIMASSPVKYVREARVKGLIHENDGENKQELNNTVSCGREVLRRSRRAAAGFGGCPPEENRMATWEFTGGP